MMGFVWRHICSWLFAIAAVLLPAYAAAGVLGALVAGVLMLAAWLVWQFFYIFKLVSWLEDPKINTVPQASGMWAKVFDTLLIQAKSRKKRKQKLGAALQRFNRAAEVVPSGILIVNKHGRITWMNLLAVQHFNLNPATDFNGILKNLVRQPDFIDFLDCPPQEQPEIKISVPLAGVFGERSLLITRAEFDKDEQLLVSRDISEAEQLNAMRTAFVANVSHELRTPLTVINGFLETMADFPDLPNEQRQQFIALMQKEGMRMQNLLADLLTLSRLESGVQTAFEPVDLSGLVEILLGDAQTLSAGRHTISAKIEPDIWVSGVYTDLYTGLSNLVFNAVRYTQNGGNILLTLEIVPQAGLSDQRLPSVRFTVRDNGPGISAEHLPHLTERFYRVDKGRSRQDGGTGLGLSIVKHVLAEHHTALKIESVIGEGSAFSAEFAQIPPPQERYECS